MLKHTGNTPDLLQALVCKLKELKENNRFQHITLDMKKYETLQRCVEGTIGDEIIKSDNSYEVTVIYPDGFGHIFPYDATLKGRQIVKWALILLPDDVPCFSITINKTGAQSSTWVYSVP